MNHTVDDIAKFYTIPDDLVNKLFSFRGVPTEFTKNAKTFGEHNIQIRSPAIEIIDYMKKTDYNKPVIRYMLCILYYQHTRPLWIKLPDISVYLNQSFLPEISVYKSSYQFAEATYLKK